jgi:hypothetical protein
MYQLNTAICIAGTVGELHFSLRWPYFPWPLLNDFTPLPVLSRVRRVASIKVFKSSAFNSVCLRCFLLAWSRFFRPSISFPNLETSFAMKDELAYQMPRLLFLRLLPKTHRHGNCCSNAMTRERVNNAAELKDLETQVRNSRELVRRSELKVEAIETSIYEIEKFYPKIKIIRRVAQVSKPAVSPISPASPWASARSRRSEAETDKSAGRPNGEPFNRVQR